ncbi:hypothetical protein QUB16_23235 [Microcoleus sp. D3_18a_C4]
MHFLPRYIRAFYILHGDAHFELTANSLSAINKLFMNGLSGPFHKKIYSLWNRHLACSCFVEQARCLSL